MLNQVIQNLWTLLAVRTHKGKPPEWAKTCWASPAPPVTLGGPASALSKGGRAVQALTCRLQREVKKKDEVQSLHTHIQGFTCPNLYFPSILPSQLQELACPWGLEVSVAYEGTVCQTSSLVPNFHLKTNSFTFAEARVLFLL